MMDEDAQRILRSALLVFTGMFLGRFVQYLTKAVLARWLQPAVYGWYVQALAVTQFAVVVGILGLSLTLPRLLSYQEGEGPPREALIGSAVLITLAGTGIVTLVHRWLAPTIAALFGDPGMLPVLRLFGLAIVPVGLYNIAVAVLRGLEDTRYRVAVDDGLFPLLELGLVGAAVVLGLGVEAAVLAWIVAASAGLVVAALAVTRLCRLDRSRFAFRPRPLLTFATPLLGVSVLFVVNRWVDVVMVGYFLPSAVTGVYEVALAVAGITGMVRSSVAYLFLPRAASLLAEGAVPALDALYRRVARWTLLLTVPVTGSLLAAPAVLLGALFGKAYAGGAVALVVLAAAYFIMSIEGPSDMLLLAGGYRWRLLAVTGSLAVIDAAANWLLIPRYGMEGAAVGMALGIVTANLLAIGFVYRRTGIHPYGRRYLRGLLAGVVVYMPLALLPLPASFVRVLGLLFAAGVAYLVMLWLLDAVDREDLRQVRALMD